jgi:hypothetical protein
MVKRCAVALLPIAVLMTGCDREVEQTVRAHMKDPSSVTFRNVERCGGDGSTVWRGEYNGKNSFAAYSGYEVFHVENGVVEFNSTGPIATKCMAEMKAYTRQIIARTKGTTR